MDKKEITVFTPTYNRAHLLPRLYKSLCDQSSSNFLWMVVDDGSTDQTRDLIKKWQQEGRIEIAYYYKENGGMHTAHNLAYRKLSTPLNVCVDSDDWMPEDAVELILDQWKKWEDREDIAGIIGLDATGEGEIIGTAIPADLKEGSLHDLYQKYGVRGDKKLVLKTEIVQKYPPYPEFKGEKLVPLDVLYLQIGVDYPFVYTNDIFCIVEYQKDGSGGTIFKQYRQSPRGFAYARKTHIELSPYFKNRMKSYIHLVSSAIFAGDFSLAFKGVNPFLSLMASPFGVILNIYIRFKIKR